MVKQSHISSCSVFPNEFFWSCLSISVRWNFTYLKTSLWKRGKKQVWELKLFQKSLVFICSLERNMLDKLVFLSHYSLKSEALVGSLQSSFFQIWLVLLTTGTCLLLETNYWAVRATRTRIREIPDFFSLEHFCLVFRSPELDQELGCSELGHCALAQGLPCVFWQEKILIQGTGSMVPGKSSCFLLQRSVNSFGKETLLTPCSPGSLGHTLVFCFLRIKLIIASWPFKVFPSGTSTKLGWGHGG